MAEYRVELESSTARHFGLPATITQQLIHALYTSAKGAVRLQVEGLSVARGTQPAWLNQAADFSVLIAEDFPGLRIVAPTLGETSPDRFGQYGLDLTQDDRPIGDETAMSLLSRGLDDALEGRADSDAFDAPLLRVFERFAPLFTAGVESVRITNGRSDSPVVVIDPSGLHRVERLHNRTPPPRQARLAGVLDAIRYSDRAFTLILQDAGETRLRGFLADEVSATRLPELWGQSVVLTGAVHFRPSGVPLRVEAAHLDLATVNDLAIFSKIPRPMDRRLDPRDLFRFQGSHSGINAIFGQWPGEESADDLIAALEQT
jgi:hypothetical protein